MAGSSRAVLWYLMVEKRWTQSDITELRNRLEVGESAADIC